MQERQEAGRRLLDRSPGRFGEAQVHDFNLVAAFLVKADRSAHQCGNAVELFLAARLVGDVALVVLGIAAVDQNRCGNALDAAAFGDLGLGRAGDLVIDDLLGFLVGVARGLHVLPLGLLALLSAGQLVADADGAVLE